MNAALQVSLWIVSAIVVVYAVYRNLKDSRRSANLRAEIAAIQEQHRGQLALHDQAMVAIVHANESLKKQLQQKEFEADANQTMYLRQVETSHSMRRQLDAQRIAKTNKNKELRTW